MKKKNVKSSPRRTKLELSRLTLDQVTAELVALGITPTEFVQYVEALHCEPPHGGGLKFKPHQVFRYDDHDKLNYADDPFLADHVPRRITSEEKAFTTWHWQLSSHEMERYLEGLSVSAMRTMLTESDDDERAFRPTRDWGKQDCERCTGYLLANRDQREFDKSVAQVLPTTKKTSKKKGTT